jgi:hypothetical protein
MSCPILTSHLRVEKLWDPFFNISYIIRRSPYLSISIICYFDMAWQISTILFGAMPRRSNRSRLLSSLALCRDRARRLFIADHVANLLDGNDQGLDMTNTSFMLVSRFTHRFHVLTQSRYSIPRTARKHQFDVFECDLNDSEDNQNWLSDDEFLCKYRMSRDTLEAVTNLIKGDQIFQRGQRGPPQLLVKHQLMIFMHFIGREGETNGNQRSVFHISQGRCQKARDRVILALTKLRDWPKPIPGRII